MSKKGVVKSLGLTLLGIILFLVKLPGLGQSIFNFLVSFFEGILDPLNPYEGIAHGINRKGELIVEKQDGTKVCVSAGEVSVRGLYSYV